MKLSKIYQNNRLLILFVSLLILLIGLPIILFLLVKRDVTSAAWFDSSWQNRQTVTVSNDTGSTLTNEDVLVTIDTATLISSGKLQSDCDDLKFVDNDDTSTLTHWIEGGCNTSSTQVWVRIPSLPSTGKTIYFYYNNSTAVNSEDTWAGNFIKLSTASCTGDWTRVGAYDGYFIRGNSSYGSTGGSSTHTHTVNGSSSTASAGGSYYDGAVSVTQYNHSHSVSEGCTTDDNTPPYLDMIFCRADNMSLTSNDILLFDTSTVTDWTRFSSLDSKFPRGASAYGGTGGSTTHSHTISLSLGSSGSGSAATCSSGCSSVASSSHSHSVSNPSSSGTNIPPYLNMVYMQKDSSGTLSDENPITILNTASMPLGWERFSALDNYFPQGASSYGATGGSSSHTHSGSVTSGGVSSTKGTISGGGRALVGGHTHSVSWSAASSSHLPPYIDVIFAKRKSSQTTTLGAEESQRPTAPTAGVATPASTSSITWNFTDNSDNETGFKVYEHPTNMLKVTCASADISSCQESGLSENTQYGRKITAYNAFGESDYSSTVYYFSAVSIPTLQSSTSTQDSVTLNSTTIANPGLGNSGYYFDCTGTSCDSGINNWLRVNTDTVSSLDNNTGYTFQVKARNGNSVETSYSATQEVWTKAEIPTLSVSDKTDTTIELSTSGVNNVDQGSSGIYFECVSGSCSTGIDEWVTVSTDTATNLTPNTQYSFSAMARNYDGDETASTINQSVYTLASIPDILEISDMSTDSMVVKINPYSNPSNTVYLLEEVNTSKYVTVAGALDVAEHWLTYSELGEASGITVSGLDSNTEYSFRVKARNHDNVETAYSSLLSKYTLISTPSAQTPDTLTSTSITWKISTTESGYDGINVYDNEDNLITTCEVADTLVCEETGLSSNVSYTRKFTIYSGIRESDFSDLITVYTLANSVGIGSGSALNDYEIYLPLSYNGNPQSTEIVLWETQTDKYYDETLGILVDSEDYFTLAVPNVTVSGLQPNTEYGFKLKAKNGDDIETSYSSEVLVRTFATAPIINSITSVDTNSMVVIINPYSNPSSTEYLLEESITGEYVTSMGTLDSSPQWLTFTQLGEVSGIEVSGLNSNTEYSFKVKARNEDGIETAFSTELGDFTLASTPGIDPITSTTSSSMTVIIDSNGNSFNTMYLLEETTTSEFVSIDGSLSSTESWLTYTQLGEALGIEVNGLDSNTQYSFRVKARNQDGIETSYSSVSSKYTRATEPDMGTISDITDTSMVVSIEPYSNPSDTEYLVQEVNTGDYISAPGELYGSEQWLTYSELGSTSGIEVWGLTSNTEYSFKVKARNGDGIETSFSSNISEYTLMPAPVAQTPDNITDSSITWKISTTTTGYDGIKVYDDENNLITTCVGSDITTCEESSLLSNSRYVRKFTTYSGIQESAYSNTSNIHTLASRVDLEPATTITSTSVTLELDYNGNPQSTDIEIWETVSDTYWDPSAGALTESQDFFDYTSDQINISGLDPNNEYSFKVRAYSFGGEYTQWSESLEVTTYAAVLEITSSITSKYEVELVVDVNNNPTDTEYDIEQIGLVGDLNVKEGAVKQENGRYLLVADTVVLEDLEPNTAYSYRIRAYNNESIATAYTEEYTVYTRIEEPEVNISNVSNTSVNISVSELSNLTEGNSGWNIEDINTWSQSSTQNINNLTPNTQYSFRVRSRNQVSQNSAWVSTNTITTLANVPEISEIEKVSSTSARILISRNNNPTSTQFAILESITEQYINENGEFVKDPVWLTYTQWGGQNGILISNIEEVKQLGFEIKARNSNNVQTAFSEAQYWGTGSLLLNIPEDLGVILKNNTDVNLSQEPQLGVKGVQIKQNDYLVADLEVSFEQDRDWEDIVIDTDVDNSKTVIKVNQEHGITEAFTMYVNKLETNAFRVCPLASTLVQVTSDCTGGIDIQGEFPQDIEIEGNIVTISQAKIDGIYYWIADGLTGTGGMGINIDLESGDIIESEEESDSGDNIVKVVSNAVSQTVQNISNTTREVAKQAILGTTEILDQTVIGTLNQEEVSNVVSTTTTVTMTVGVATTGISQTFYLLLHFINGLLNTLGFRRKRLPFGYVYDSRSKNPISNAVVRIFKGKDLVETTVTDVNGIFVSKLESGKYKLELRKSGYVFPSILIKSKQDYPFDNIYLGGILEKKDNTDVTVHIPLDKKELSVIAKLWIVLKNISSYIFTILNVGLFIFGIMMLLYTYYKFPMEFNWYWIPLYLPALYFLSNSLFRKGVRYGKLVDKEGNLLIEKEVLLVEKEFNEVVDKRVTDSSGRYRFVCKKGLYKVMVGKKVVLDDLVVKKDGYVFREKIIV